MCLEYLSTDTDLSVVWRRPTDDYVIVSVLTASNTKRKTDDVRFGAYQKLSKKYTAMKKEILGDIVPFCHLITGEIVQLLPRL